MRVRTPRFQDFEQHPGSAYAGLIRVIVWGSVVSHHGIDVTRHFGHDVGVHVEGHGDGNVWADGGAQRRQQVVFATVQPFGPHGAVEEQANAVDMMRSFQHCLFEPLVGVMGHHTAGHRAGRDCGHQVRAVRLQRIDDPGQRVATHLAGQDVCTITDTEVLAPGQEMA